MLVREEQPLVECLSSFMDVQERCDMVVMGSAILGSALQDTNPMGSVAMCMIKATVRTLLVIKSNCKLGGIDWETEKLRVVINVDHAARPLLKYACNFLLNRERADKLYLAKPLVPCSSAGAMR